MDGGLAGYAARGLREDLPQGAVLHHQEPVGKGRSCGRCSMTMMVVCSSRRSLSMTSMNSQAPGTGVAVGSSRISTWGCMASTEAIATRCFSRLKGYRLPGPKVQCPNGVEAQGTRRSISRGSGKVLRAEGHLIDNLEVQSWESGSCWTRPTMPASSPGAKEVVSSDEDLPSMEPG